MTSWRDDFGPRGEFHWKLVIVVAVLDLFLVLTLMGLSALIGSGLIPIEEDSKSVEAFRLALQWINELLRLPMSVFSGSEGFAIVMNSWIHGFIVERIVEFFRYRGERHPAP